MQNASANATRSGASQFAPAPWVRMRQSPSPLLKRCNSPRIQQRNRDAHSDQRMVREGFQVPNRPSVSREQIKEFLSRRAEQLVEVFLGDPKRAKQEIFKRVNKLVLTPESRNGRDVFVVTGDLVLFADDDVIPLNSRRRSCRRMFLGLSAQVIGFQNILAFPLVSALVILLLVQSVFPELPIESRSPNTEPVRSLVFVAVSVFQR